MKILHMTSHLNAGGVAYSVLSVARGLSLRKHQVCVAAGEGSLAVELKSAGIAHWRAPLDTSMEFSPRVFGASKQLLDRIAKEPVDVIHAHTRTSQVSAQLLSRRFDIPYVVTWHGFFKPNIGRWLFPCLGDRTIAISEPVKRHLIKTFKVPESRIRLIPHGIDPSAFGWQDDSSRRLRSQLQIPDEAPVIGTIARLVASKGVDQLIRAAVLIRGRIPQAHFLIVGDGEEKANLQALAAELGCADIVHFAGTVHQTAAALSLMDVFVFLPAHQEGFGLVLLEAMANARPIAAVYRGVGAAWLIDQIPMIKKVEPDSPSALADAVIQYLQDRPQAAASGESARALIKERFSLERMVDQVELVYRELVR